MMRLTGFSGRIALVTGAAGGIGRALTRALRAAGAQVIATDLRAPPAAPAVTPFALDLRDPAAAEALVARVEAEIGPIDLLASLAGVLVTGEALETCDADWRLAFEVNAFGTFHITRAVGRRMKPRGGGAMVAVTSNAGGVPRHGMAAYGASKAAAAMYMRSLGMELAPHGIRCNIVAPGSTRTPMQTGMWAGPEGEAEVIRGRLETFKPGIPLGRIAAPEDVADAVMFLLSDQARHITMADLYVDGGATQRG